MHACEPTGGGEVVAASPPRSPAGRPARRGHGGLGRHDLQAPATPSRLLILTALRRAPHAVGDLAAVEQSAVSHQLRLLRALHAEIAIC
ncbi:ArsR family transcriptional regulator [Streptomyces sp. TRM68367]|uniref:ArsR family transcriptional regulator n=1 Tax=Streptomyces sp. TRM68367 TaxID=2758415 RepID=UPI002934157A|nr:ArsR family transcriptional regulator [Streptomyces sp. TRM68367]